MQTDDINASPKTPGEPIPASQPAGLWTTDQNAGNWTSTRSAGGYGRQDPEEFGPEPIDRGLPRVDLIPEVIPLERVHFEPENRITEPAANTGITAAEIIGADLSSETSPGLQRFQPHQEPPLETGNPNSGPWDYADRGTEATPASPDSETFVAVDSDIQPGSVNGQPLQDAPDSGIALWPETSFRDQAEETQPAATPHDDRHQVIEPPTDKSGVPSRNGKFCALSGPCLRAQVPG